MVQLNRMIEVERKYRVLNKGKLRRQLIKLGAKFVGRKEQIDTYYSPPQESFLGKEKYLRVRETRQGKNIKARFEYHLPFSKYASHENEVAVDSVSTLYYILKSLGFVKEMIVKKKREKWVWRGVNIEIDQVTGLGNFVEIEVIGKAEAEALKKIDAVGDKLGFSPTETLSGYFKLLLKKQRPFVWQKYYDKQGKK